MGPDQPVAPGPNQAVELTTDRADQPATRTRHELAATTPPAPALTPRCEIPNWFEQLHRDARNEYAAARAEQRHDAARQQRIDDLTQQLDSLDHRCAPHDHAISTVSRDLQRAEHRHRQAERQLANSGLLHRRTARHAVTEAGQSVATARTALDELTRRAQPLLDQRNHLRHERDHLRREHQRDQQFSRSLDHDRLGTARQQLDALDIWHQWASGKSLSPAALINTARQLQHPGGHHAHLAQPLATWIEQHDLAPQRPTPTQQHTPQLERRPEPPGLDIGF